MDARRGLHAAFSLTCLAGFAALALAGCGDGTAAGGPAGAPIRVEVAGEPPALTPWPASVTELRWAVTPYDDRRILEQTYRPLIDYLSRRIGIPIRFELTADYASTTRGIVDGTFDAALGTPLTYVEAIDRDPGIRLLAAQVAEGTTSYLGYVFTRAEDPARSLPELAGRSFCYVDPHSASGYIYPRAMLRQAGFDPETFFGHTEFGGNHFECLRRVLAREVDAACISSGAVSTARREGLPIQDIKVLAKTPRIPFDAWVASSRLPDAAVERLRQELLALSTRSPDGREVLQGPIRLNAFMAVDDAHYDSVRAARALSGPTPPVPTAAAAVR